MKGPPSRVNKDPVATRNSFAPLQTLIEDQDQEERQDMDTIVSGGDMAKCKHSWTPTQKDAKNSRRTVREGQRRQRPSKPCVNLLLSEPNAEIHNAANGLERIEVIVDSGAAESVAPPSVGRGFRVRESEVSRVGQKYVTADGTALANLGEKCIKATTNEGHCVNLGFQMAEVTKPLASVGRICDSGNEVTFGPNGGVIYNAMTGCVTEIKRTNGVYVLEAWAETTGFARPE